MEVLLPPNFYESLLVPHSTEGYRVNQYFHGNTLVCYYLCNIESRFSFRRKPPVAIYTTMDVPSLTNVKLNYSAKGTVATYPDFDNFLLTVPIKKDGLGVFPDSEYCVIQSERLFKEYKIDLIGEYPNTLNGIYEFLISPHERYGGVPTYKIIRRQVFLIRVLGNEKVESEEFQSLLMIDCEELSSLVNPLLRELNIVIDRQVLTPRNLLLSLLASNRKRDMEKMKLLFNIAKLQIELL
jgi:hypothetical protein